MPMFEPQVRSHPRGPVVPTPETDLALDDMAELPVSATPG